MEKDLCEQEKISSLKPEFNSEMSETVQFAKRKLLD